MPFVSDIYGPLTSGNVFFPSFFKKTSLYGSTPLHFVGNYGNIPEAQVLIQNGAVVNTANNYDLTPLERAYNNGYLEAAKFLVERGGDINVVSGYGETPFHMVCVPGRCEEARFFIEREGADVYRVTDCGRAPLHLACDGDDVSLVQLIIDNGTGAI